MQVKEVKKNIGRNAIQRRHTYLKLSLTLKNLSLIFFLLGKALVTSRLIVRLGWISPWRFPSLFLIFF